MRTTWIFLFILTNTVFQGFAQNEGNALNFNAVNGYCTSGLPTVFDDIATNDFTVECWVKSASSSTSKRVFFAQKDVNNFCSILINSSNTPYFFLRKNGTYYSANLQTTLSTTQWNHIAFSWDASTNTITGFINGNQVSGINGGSSSTGNDQIMTIGARSDGGQIFNGSIDEFRIWDDIRTPCEILAGMNTQFTSAQPNLIASYSFNQGVAGGDNTGVTTLNELNSSYTGSLIGFTLNGDGSNWVASGATVSQTNNNSETYYTPDVINACFSYDWIDGNTYYANNTTATYSYTSPGGCNCIRQLDLTIDAPVTADAPANVSACESYNLPALTTGNYYTQSNGNGIPLAASDVISGSQTLYVYAENGTCSSENAFDITIDTPMAADSLSDVTVCEGYILPALNTGNYYTGSAGSGTLLTAGELISGTQTLYVYAENGTCSDENPFTITIDTPVTVDSLSDVSACEGFYLQVLTTGNYYTESNGSGTLLTAGELISGSQVLYVYAENGTCSDESSFTITIDTPVTADSLSDVSACDGYSLPILTSGNYYTESNGSGTLLTAGDLISGSQTLYVYAENGSCSSENSFVVTIHATPVNTVSVADNVLTADQSGVSYQWLDCNNAYALIQGETNQSFAPAENGNYALLVSDNSCSDTSECVLISTIGLTEIADNGGINIYPNPTSGFITIQLPEQQHAIIQVYNSLGALVSEHTSDLQINSITINGEAGGYFIKVKTNNTTQTHYIIKQ